jgi:hypothetical protein
MTTPTITTIPTQSGKQCMDGQGYQIHQAGGFQGIWWEAGTLVKLDKNLQPGAILLLEPRRRGTPRFGTNIGGVLRGSSGEPCSPLRWRVVGRVVKNTHDVRPRQLSLFS